MKELRFAPVDTPKGVFLIYFTEAGIYEVAFPGAQPVPGYPRAPLPWPGLADDLNQYLSGCSVDWSVYPLDRSGYPPFIAAVLTQVGLIPYGSVITYREAAERAGSPLAWRAAGQALKTNRHPIIVPCHRVIGSNGRLGGFSGPAGWKEMLLTLEGVDL